MRGIGFPMFNHLSDEKLSRLTAGELGAVQRFLARAHLEKCWQCRLRREALERSALQLAEYRNCLVERIPSNPDRRAAMLRHIRQSGEAVMLSHESSRAVFSTKGTSSILKNPILASIFVAVFVAGLLLTVGRRHATTVSAAELLNRAENADRAVLTGKPGVIYEKISIRTSKGRIEHEIYRDAHRERRRRISVSDTEIVAPLRNVLVSAHVELDDPFSVASYRAWHDEQREKTDAVSRDGNGLLTLSTLVQDGNIRQETLTVRASDFHPVQRTIRTADDGVVEIAELNYALLDWSSVNGTLFDSPSRVGLPAPAAAVVPVPALLPSPAALDIAELNARVAIHRLHGDEGEQIEIDRTTRSIDVRGVVDTEARKLEINGTLHALPYVRSSVLSVADQQGIEASSAQKTIVTIASGDANSTLENYLASESQGSKENLFNSASRGLLDASLKVRSNSNELLALRAHFSSLADRSSAGLAVQELTHSYSERLVSGLDAEVSMLGKLGFAAPSEHEDKEPLKDLDQEVARNNALCLELIAGDAGSGRPASEVIQDIYTSIRRIHSVLASSAEGSSR
jgi:hypothetical protein